jgi:hypothetical protein
MKTAMQELIEELKTNDVAHGMYWIKQPDEFFEKYLEKEKEQILNAYQQGHGDAGWTEDKYEPLEYYDKTYNQNK